MVVFSTCFAAKQLIYIAMLTIYVEIFEYFVIYLDI